MIAAGCKRIFEEIVCGAKKDRPELNKMLDHLRHGDVVVVVVVVTRLDRLARSTIDLLHIGGEDRGGRSRVEVAGRALGGFDDGGEKATAIAKEYGVQVRSVYRAQEVMEGRIKLKRHQQQQVTVTGFLSSKMMDLML
ncbi:recombinase family protein [Rhizobium phaseoli]|uniref:recombinase family protein n=1 Tax=Rhizobium phaseoli TaxID=396 RepID=UPI001FE12A18|nr:recombinase family protein [Rhizobium phaseoli]